MRRAATQRPPIVESVLSTMRIKFKLDGVALEMECAGEWDASDTELKIQFLGLSWHLRRLVTAVLKGTGVFKLMGINDPSCPYAVDVIITDGMVGDVTFREFRWETWDAEDRKIEVVGSYGAL